jgi:hypothetical protein
MGAFTSINVGAGVLGPRVATYREGHNICYISSGCHSERSEESAVVWTSEKCRFLAPKSGARNDDVELN